MILDDREYGNADIFPSEVWENTWKDFIYFLVVKWDWGWGFLTLERI